MYKQMMFAIAAAVLLTAFVSVAPFGLNQVKAQAPPPPGGTPPPGGAAPGGNMSAGGNATGNATGGNATAGAAGGNTTK